MLWRHDSWPNYTIIHTSTNMNMTSTYQHITIIHTYVYIRVHPSTELLYKRPPCDLGKPQNHVKTPYVVVYSKNRWFDWQVKNNFYSNIFMLLWMNWFVRIFKTERDIEMWCERWWPAVPHERHRNVVWMMVVSGATWET